MMCEMYGLEDLVEGDNSFTKLFSQKIQNKESKKQ